LIPCLFWNARDPAARVGASGTLPLAGGFRPSGSSSRLLSYSCVRGHALPNPENPELAA
jgi:hypothetical protein